MYRLRNENARNENIIQNGEKWEFWTLV